MADANNAQIGSQVTFSIWDTVVSSPPAWVSLGKVRSIGGYGEDLPEVDSTTLDSLAVERISGLPDGTEMSVMCTFRPVTLALMEAIDAAKANVDARLVWPAAGVTPGTTRYFAVTPRGFTIPTITPSGLIELDAKFRRSSPASTTPSHA